MDIKQYLEEKRVLVEEALELYMLKTQGPLSAHIKSMNYSLFASGKRVRPILCLAATEALGGQTQKALPTACALECIHTYSLIHDDLPAMDNDDYRRGSLTNHKIFGEAGAILAGDGLLTFAFQLLSTPDLDLTSDKERIRVIYLIAQAAGSLGMVGGQALDIACEGKDVPFDTLKVIHSCKTGSLITASVQTGAVLAGASRKELAAITLYGQNIGLAFQIVDDLLNVEGTLEQLGKSAGSDEARKKVTYPSLFGIEETRKKARKASDAAIEAIVDFNSQADPLRDIARYIINRKR